MGILLKNLNKKTPVISRCLFVLIELIIFNNKFGFCESVKKSQVSGIVGDSLGISRYVT